MEEDIRIKFRKIDLNKEPYPQEEERIPLPEITSVEIDLEGNTKKVALKDDKAVSKSDNRLMAVPSDGFQYVFNGYEVGNPTINYHYKKAGIYRVENRKSIGNMDLVYEQTEDESVTWDVTVNLSTEGSIGNAFLAKLTSHIGLTVNKSKNWTKGTRFALSGSVEPGKVVELINWQVAVQDSGYVVYLKKNQGTVIGTYKERAGGYAIATTYVNIEAVDA